MASISSVEERYNKLCSNYEENVNSKVAFGYEDSMVCNEDSNAMKSFNALIETINSFGSGINNVISSCPSNFDVSHGYLGEVKSYIGKGISQITALNDRIKTFSLQVYDEYKSEFDNLKSKYERYAKDGKDLLKKAKSALASAERYRELANNYANSDDATMAANAASLSIQANEKEEECKKYLNSIQALVLPYMEDSINDMVILLEKGLLSSKK